MTLSDLTGGNPGCVPLNPFGTDTASADAINYASGVPYRNEIFTEDDASFSINGEPFSMIKLRTMVDGADALKPALVARNEAVGLFKIDDDPRITARGHLPGDRPVIERVAIAGFTQQIGRHVRFRDPRREPS